MGLPTGPAVTFLFTDIEGSTRLERAAGSSAWAGLVARHDHLVRGAIEASGGVVVKTEGDAFFAAFERPADAVVAAVAAQRAIAEEPWPEACRLRVRMGLHLGEGRLRQGLAADAPGDYVGIDVNYAARIAAAGNGGQIVISDAIAGALPTALAEVPGLAGVHLFDAGLRTVKDFEEPARLHRLVVPDAAADDRPLRTLDAPTNLPGDVTVLVGRDAEIETLSRALADTRILTLTGPGGSGKTRLALGLARAVRDRFPSGVWFVDIAAERDPKLVDFGIAAAVGVRETPDSSAGEVLRAHLRDWTALLLLDNLEQLLPDAADTVASLVRAAPNLRVLVTSRELLRIAGERGHSVPPLDTTAAVTLFLDRARALRPDLTLTEEARAAVLAITERLGGLPLAIELAAARTRLLSPALILERLGRALDLGGGTRDLPERQRTLRGAITWSHELLSTEEQRLFARLAVFADGWVADSALAVADPDGTLGVDLIAGLESLADKSLIRIEPGGPDGPGKEAETRFNLHPLLREFALERLAESGEQASLEERFAEQCATIAEAAGRAIFGPSGEAVIRQLDRESHNMRAAIDWALDNDRPGVGLRITGSIWRWFQQRGRLREARPLLARLLAHPAPTDVRTRIAGLAAEGGLAYWMNDVAGARTAYEERLTLATTTGDPVLEADAHYDIGFLFMLAQEADALRTHEQRALDLYVAAGREDGAVRARQALVLAVFLVGEYETARRLEMENLEVFRRTGSKFQIADSMTLLSAVHWRLGDPATSWLRLTEGLRIFEDTDLASGLARSLGMAAIIELSDGDAEFGARLAGATYRLVEEKAVMLAPVKVLHLPDPGETAAERFGPERAAALMAEGAGTPLVEIIAAVLAAAVPGSPPTD